MIIQIDTKQSVKRFREKCFWLIASSILLLAFASGCEDKNSDYINLSFNSFTFSAKGTEEITIEVKASGSWTVEYEGIGTPWVVEKEKQANTITFGALPTQSGADRILRVAFRSGNAVEYVNFSQLGTNVSYSLLEPNSVLTVLSPNGKYVGGVATTITNNAYEFIPFIVHVETGERVEKPKLTKAHIASAISDEGFLIIQEEEKSTGQYYDGDELVAVEAPAGMARPSITAVSSDGKIWTGYAHSGTDRRYYPVKWVDKKPIVLEMPEKTLLNTSIEVGAYARGCSADGSLIYGALADDQTGLYWKDDKVEFLGKDKIKVHTIVVNHTGQDIAFAVVDRPLFYADHTSMSPNGRYLATTFAEVTAPNKYEKSTYYPAYFDFETETLTYITDMPEGFENATGITISDDGILSFACPAIGFTHAFVHDIHTKITYPTPDYIRENYGVTVSEGSLVTKNTNDGKTVFGISVVLVGVSYQYWYLNVVD